MVNTYEIGYIGRFSRRIRSFRLVSFVVLFVILISPPLTAAGYKTIPIAAVFSMTGIAAKHNAPMVEMVRLAVESINQDGGVLGQRIELLVLDNQSTPIGSALAARKAVELGAVAVIGAYWNSHSIAMAPIFEEAGIPMISPASTNPALTEDRDYVFRACFVDSFQGKAMAYFARDTLGARRAVVVNNVDEEYSSTLAHFFKWNFEAKSGEVLANLSYRGDATDFSEVISMIKKLKPDVIFLPGYTRDSGLFIRQARKLGVDTTFLGGDGWEEIASIAAGDIEGSYQTVAWHPVVPNQSSRRLKKLFRQKYKTEITNFNSPLAYDAVMLLKDAIAKCRSLEGEAIKNALLSQRSYQGATGEIAFDRQGNPEGKDVIIIQFQDSMPSYVETLKP